MRRVALQKGVRIYEHTPATEILRGRPPVVRTPLGAIVADKVVLATNAWMCSLPEIRRAVLPMSSDMIATAPIPERLQEIGWTSGQPVGDSHMMVHYYRTTRDGRIAFGKGGCSHVFMGQIGPELEDPGARVQRTVRSFNRIYPMLTDVPITHTWTGPIDRSETNSLFFGHLDGTPDIIYGVGYSGTGVAPSYVSGHVLASTALDLRDEWQDSPINRGPRSLYPVRPDPLLRWEHRAAGGPPERSRHERQPRFRGFGQRSARVRAVRTASQTEDPRLSLELCPTGHRSS